MGVSAKEELLHGVLRLWSFAPNQLRAGEAWTRKTNRVPSVQAEKEGEEEMTLDESQINLVLGALDSMAVALADHGHTWTDGERAIYEQACEILGKPTETIED